jgi:hypothetical protein
LKPVLAKHGWKLLGSYASVVGRLNAVIDLWELPNEAAIQTALSDSEVAKLASPLGEIIEDQTLSLLNKLPISYLTGCSHWACYRPSATGPYALSARTAELEVRSNKD